MTLTNLRAVIERDRVHRQPCPKCPHVSRSATAPGARMLLASHLREHGVHPILPGSIAEGARQ
jgi:hypothetical protein